MIDSILILSDIHGNLSALDAVIKDFESKNYHPGFIALLGDNINYGMRPNEVLARLKGLSYKYNVKVNIMGNHEKALLDYDTTHFSTDRGRRILDYTRNILTSESLEYIDGMTKEGYSEMEIGGKRILFLHGNIDDCFWGKLNNNTVDDFRYSAYDYVISGHSHVPHLIEHFFSVDDNLEYRNKKRTIFINPGSVGQPRNHNPRAQYAYVNLDQEIFMFNSVNYDIDSERALFTDGVDRFYSDRLINGI